jgi:hypothetical protein
VTVSIPGQGWFYLDGHMTKRKNNWSTENPYCMPRIPFHDIKVDVLCALNARRIVVCVLSRNSSF